MNPNLARDELRIWIISLDRLATTCDWELLDDIECRRAERFALGVDRSRFVVAHASLRRILFHHTGIAPQQLQFRNGPQGKPYVDVGERPRPIQFNLAHSGSVAALAVQLQTEVGVDVERIERIRDAAAIARRYFHPDETAWLDERRNEVRNQCFLKLWTMKEACIKASGIGLSKSLDSYCMVGTNRQTELIVNPLSLRSGYCGAVAYRPPPLHVVVRQYASS